MFAAITLVVIGVLILVTWYGVLSLIDSVSVLLCFTGAFLATSKRDFLGRFWGGMTVAVGIAVFIASKAGMGPAIATLFIGAGIAYVFANAVRSLQ